MAFSIEELEKLLPPELTDQKKGRLREGLMQFSDPYNLQDKFYTDFYLPISHNYFLQGDMIREMRFSSFNQKTGQYNKLYYDALIVSNTCDIDESNKRTLRKKVVLAKLITVDVFIESLRELGVENAAEILTHVKNQQYSNIIYLPSSRNKQDYLAYLDDISIVEKEEINILKEDISSNRIESLDYFGYYLFIFKLSYHMCRLPEETER
jgi:hypothetical protein